MIDLDDPEQIQKVDIYVEATLGASEMLSEKQASEENGGRRNSVDGSKGSDAFISDLRQP